MWCLQWYKSSKIIYCLSCKRCGIQYVGQTKNLMDRFQAHFYNIGHNKAKNEIGRHFNQPDHKGMDEVEIHILDFIHAHPEGKKAKYLRDLVEFNWIQRLHKKRPPWSECDGPPLALHIPKNSWGFLSYTLPRQHFFYYIVEGLENLRDTP